MTKISKKDFRIKENVSISYNDFSREAQESHVMWRTKTYEVFLGTWTVAKIIQPLENKFFVSKLYDSCFGSLNSALDGILRRMNATMEK